MFEKKQLHKHTHTHYMFHGLCTDEEIYIYICLDQYTLASNRPALFS